MEHAENNDRAQEARARAFEALKEEFPRLVARIDGISADPSAGGIGEALEELSCLTAHVDGLFRQAGLPADELEKMLGKLRSPELGRLLEQAGRWKGPGGP